MTNKVLLAFAAIAATAFAASAADYYVSTTGNDANDGLTWATAKASIAGAYALASDSTADTIHVADGTYNAFVFQLVDEVLHLARLGKKETSRHGMETYTTVESLRQRVVGVQLIACMGKGVTTFEANRFLIFEQ